MKKHAHETDNTINPLFQITIGVITLLFLLISFTFRPFITSDIEPQKSIPQPQELFHYKETAHEVRVGFVIRNFEEFNIVKNSFVISGYVWFEFDPSIVSLKTISGFNFEQASILTKSEPTIRINGDRIIATFDIRVSARSGLQYNEFPFDDHRLYFVLSIDSISPRELYFVSSAREFIVASDVSILGWKLRDTHVESSYLNNSLDALDARKNITHPQVIFSIDYERMGIRYILLLILPLYLIFLLISLSYSLDDQYQSSIISLASGGISAIVAYRFVIESFSPSVGYFMNSDYFFFLFLVAAFVIFLSTIFKKHMSRGIKKLILIILNGIIIIFSFTLI
jgi:hypothetical protein